MEYIVLYTHQKSKKSKTWQDGLLQVNSNRGILYDEKKTKLDTLFIRCAQVLTGEEIESDRYLIQIEDLVAEPSASVPPSVPSNRPTGGFVGRPVPRSAASGTTQGVYPQASGPPRTGTLQPQRPRIGLKRKRTGFVPPRAITSIENSCGSEPSPPRFPSLHTRVSGPTPQAPPSSGRHDPRQDGSPRLESWGPTAVARAPGHGQDSYSKGPAQSLPWSVIGQAAPPQPHALPLPGWRSDGASSAVVMSSDHVGCPGNDRKDVTEKAASSEKRSTSRILALIGRKASVTSETEGPPSRRIDDSGGPVLNVHLSDHPTCADPPHVGITSRELCEGLTSRLPNDVCPDESDRSLAVKDIVVDTPTLRGNANQMIVSCNDSLDNSPRFSEGACVAETSSGHGCTLQKDVTHIEPAVNAAGCGFASPPQTGIRDSMSPEAKIALSQSSSRGIIGDTRGPASFDSEIAQLDFQSPAQSNSSKATGGTHSLTTVETPPSSHEDSMVGLSSGVVRDPIGSEPRPDACFDLTFSPLSQVSLSEDEDEMHRCPTSAESLVASSAAERPDTNEKGCSSTPEGCLSSSGKYTITSGKPIVIHGELVITPEENTITVTPDGHIITSQENFITPETQKLIPDTCITSPKPIIAREKCIFREVHTPSVEPNIAPEEPMNCPQEHINFPEEPMNCPEEHINFQGEHANKEVERHRTLTTTTPGELLNAALRDSGGNFSDSFEKQDEHFGPRAINTRLVSGNDMVKYVTGRSEDFTMEKFASECGSYEEHQDRFPSDCPLARTTRLAELEFSQDTEVESSLGSERTQQPPVGFQEREWVLTPEQATGTHAVWRENERGAEEMTVSAAPVASSESLLREREEQHASDAASCMGDWDEIRGRDGPRDNRPYTYISEGVSHQENHAVTPHALADPLAVTILQDSPVIEDQTFRGCAPTDVRIHTASKARHLAVENENDIRQSSGSLSRNAGNRVLPRGGRSLSGDSCGDVRYTDNSQTGVIGVNVPHGETRDRRTAPVVNGQGIQKAFRPLSSGLPHPAELLGGRSKPRHQEEAANNHNAAPMQASVPSLGGYTIKGTKASHVVTRRTSPGRRQSLGWGMSPGWGESPGWRLSPGWQPGCGQSADPRGTPPLLDWGSVKPEEGELHPPRTPDLNEVKVDDLASLYFDQSTEQMKETFKQENMITTAQDLVSQDGRNSVKQSDPQEVPIAVNIPAGHAAHLDSCLGVAAQSVPRGRMKLKREPIRSVPFGDGVPLEEYAPGRVPPSPQRGTPPSARGGAHRLPAWRQDPPGRGPTKLAQTVVPQSPHRQTPPLSARGGAHRLPAWLQDSPGDISLSFSPYSVDPRATAARCAGIEEESGGECLSDGDGLTDGDADSVVRTEHWGFMNNARIQRRASPLPKGKPFQRLHNNLRLLKESGEPTAIEETGLSRWTRFADAAGADGDDPSRTPGMHDHHRGGVDHLVPEEGDYKTELLLNSDENSSQSQSTASIGLRSPAPDNTWLMLSGHGEQAEDPFTCDSDEMPKIPDMTSECVFSVPDSAPGILAERRGQRAKAGAFRPPRMTGRTTVYDRNGANKASPCPTERMQFKTPVASHAANSFLNASQRNLCGELVFPSRSDAEANVTPARQLSIPPSFPSVQVYKQVLTAALQEHLNIQLLEVSKAYHAAAAHVDTQGYSAAPGSRPGRGRQQPSPVSTNPPCDHGRPSKIVQVKKEGANKGRFFFTCNGERNQQCKFFKWTDEKSRGGEAGMGGGGSGGRGSVTPSPTRLALGDAHSINTYFKGQHVALYCECQLLRKVKETYRKHLKNYPAWVKKKMQLEGDYPVKKKLFIRLSRKEASSAYTKDDLWIISQSLTFDPASTFLARSAFYGPSAQSEVEVDPISGYSPSNWQNEMVCHVIHAGNVSSELVSLANLTEYVNPASMPITPHLLNRTPEVNLKEWKIFHIPSEILVDSVEEFVTKHRLNADQAEALSRIAAMFVSRPSGVPEVVTLIHGVFGAGKSFLLAVVVLFLVHIFEVNDRYTPGVPEPCKILISSTTNVAVDRILMGLIDLGFEEFVRVGSVKKIAKPVLPYSVHASGSDSQEMKDLQEMLKADMTQSERINVRKTMEKLRNGENKKKLSQVGVVGVTCAACPFNVMQELKFTVVMLDECSQMTEPSSLLPVARFGCQRLVLVGDPKQLSPTIQGSTADHDSSLEQTLFDRLIKMGHEAVMLRTQYRCHPVISALANQLFYGGCLRDGISASDRPPLGPGWPTLCFLDVPDGREGTQGGGSFHNVREAQTVVTLLECLASKGVPPADMGVITLYRAQQSAVLRMIPESRAGGGELSSVLVSTVDAFQGGQRGVIILSCVRTHFVGFIDSDKRTNVALTRAKNHLFIVGHRNNLAKNPLWARVLQYCNGVPGGVQDARQFVESRRPSPEAE